MNKLLPLLCLLCSSPTFAADPPLDAAAAEALAAEHDTVFVDYQSQLKSGQKARAADALVEIIKNPEKELYHLEAYQLFGDILQGMDLSYGALIAYSRALNTTDPSAKLIEDAFKLADTVGDAAMLQPVFAENVGGNVDKLTRSRMAYLAARESYLKQSYSLALGLLKLVVKESPVFPDAKMLEGVILNQQSRPTDALSPLVMAYSTGETAKREQRFLDAANLNIARSYFAAQNYPRAIEYYAKVSRESDFWLEAQYERAWSHFRIEDMNGAIALLHNHHSPFFESYYFPEGELLRIYSLFLLCKFPAASNEIDNFKALYQPLHASLSSSLTGLAPEQAFEVVRDYIKTGEVESSIPETMIRRYKNEGRIIASINAIEHAEDEAKRLGNIAANPFTTEVTKWVNARRNQLILEEGNRILATLNSQHSELGGMLASAELSKLDMLQMETRLYEQASIVGKIEKERRVQREARIRKGYVSWPWQGEYWADELGYYKIDSLPECPAGLRTNQE